jgi:dienelactone hydrolase
MKTVFKNLVSAVVLSVAAFSTWAQTTIEFNSLNGKQGFPAILQGRAQYTDKISGVFTRPAGAKGEVPAMIIMHSSGGINNTTWDWSKYFLDMGIATFVVDSFKPRGIENTASDQSQLNNAASTADALTALKVVAAQPGIDAKRIGAIGFSRGGGASFTATYPNVHKAVLGEDSPKFALSVVFYGGYILSGTTTTPMLYLMGDSDDYQSVEATTAFIADLRSRGNDISFKVYPDATHGFDVEHAKASIYAARAQVWKKCYPRAVDLDNMTYSVGNVVVTPKEFGESMNKCSSLGVTVSFNRKARDDARNQVKDFVTKVFGLQR